MGYATVLDILLYNLTPRKNKTVEQDIQSTRPFEREVIPAFFRCDLKHNKFEAPSTFINILMTQDKIYG